jgi:hypothetical protein
LSIGLPGTRTSVPTGIFLAWAATFYCLAADLEISRPVRSWEFLDAVGPRAGLLGHENGALEGYVYPLKIFKDLRLRFVSDGQVLPAETLARRITSRPGSYTITYTGDDFRVTETLVVPIDEPGALILLDVFTRSPLRINVEFTRDFQLMWPAAIGSGYAEWSEQHKSFLFGADGHPFAAILGSPDAALISREHATDYSTSTLSGFTLGTINGHAERVITLAGSMKSRDDTLGVYRLLLKNPHRLVDDTESYYRDYLANTIKLQLPDDRLQRAYDWSRISMVKGFVDNPFLGRGLVAGYGPSKGGYRPGYSWFFGRDTFWTSLALSASGDFAGARTAIDFISKFQRDDGKLPHEISQAATFVDWFKQFPYGYASADATPLFAIAVRDYVQASGDAAFAREQAPKLWKALDFMRSTLDEAGFPKNMGVGHGWVEGGRLLPVRTELYQAGCYVEALRALAYLAHVLNDGQRAQSLEAEFEQKHHALNDLYWLPQSHSYAFAIGTDGKPVDQPSVLATVPMWFDLLDRRHAKEMIGQLADEAHAADWGMRIISSKNPLYDPSGYHYGSVWPLFTGWASVGEYRNHEAEPALANLLANAWLTLDGAGGNPTEVLSGDTYSPLSTASPHQIWSAAMVVSPLLRGLLGLESDAFHKRVQFAPHLPADWQTVGVHRVPFLGGRIDFDIHRDASTLELKIENSGSQSFDLDFAPAYPPCAHVTGATLDGEQVTWKEQAESNDWHPRFTVSVKPGTSIMVIRHRGFFGYIVPFSPPRLAEPSANLKVVSEQWTNNNQTLELTVSGRPGRDYRIGLVGAKQGDSVVVRMPAGASGEYVQQRFTISP